MTTPSPGPLQVVILCGLPFAGKSTLARALADRLDLVHVEVDEVVHQAETYAAGESIPRSAWITAYRASYRRMEAALAEGRSVVLDATNYRRLHRDLIRAKAARFGAEAIVVRLDVPTADIDARRARNRLTPLRPDVGDDDFSMVQTDMQLPGPDEHPITYSPDMTVENIVAHLAQAVGSAQR